MKDTLKVRVRFGAFELDLKSGELLDLGSGELGEGKRKVVLPEQPFRVLRMLIERAGSVVSREEIQKALWPNDTIVEFDRGINAVINKLRKLFGDSADEPRYIETMARRGYRLVAPVEWLESSPGDEPSSVESDGADGDVPPLDLEPASLSGKTVSHYRVLEIVGGGGMGLVYRAEDIKLGRAVALKVLPEDVGHDQRMLERFELEARAASSLDHVNICPIFEFGEHEGQPFIVMQLLTGHTLRDRMAVQGTDAARTRKAVFGVDELLDIGLQIARGLEAAHEKGIIHRDIKPANIFLTDKGVVKILDFGLAKLLQPSGENLLAMEASAVLAPEELGRRPRGITRLGVAVGTEGYMSPEQVRSEQVDARTDLFSFGVVLYEMATGKRAFSGKTEAIVRAAIAQKLPVPVHELNPSLPPELEPIINKALEKDRAQRYQSAAEICADLEAVKRSRQPAPPQRVVKPSRWKAWQLALAAVLVCAVIGAVWWWLLRTPKIADVVLADFNNATADPVLSSLNTALRVELEQTPYLNLLSADKVRGILKSLDHPENLPLTPELATEVCQHSNSKAVAAGSIRDVGNRYRIELKATDCKTGKTLATTAQETANRDEIVKALGIAGSDFRRKLGEPHDSLQKFNQPLELATTSSLEALRAFADGVEQKHQRGDVASLPHFKRAVELDPNFADAYALLGVGYHNIVQVSSSVENLQKAYDLRDRVTQRQRFYIDGVYSAVGTEDLQKAIRTFREWSQTYPRDPTAQSNLSAASLSLGQYEAAAKAAEESIRLKPSAAAYTDEVSAYIRLNKLDDAGQALDEAQALHIGSSLLPLARYRLAFLKGDQSALQEQVTSANGPSRGGLLTLQSYTESYYGRIRKARELSDQVVNLARQDSAPDSAADCLTGNALREAEVGNGETARQLVAQALALSTDRDNEANAALALARIGDWQQAEKLAQQLGSAYPKDTMMQNYSLPTIRAAIELQKNNPANAVDILSATLPYELGSGSFENLYPAYVRGEAYLKLGQGPQAAAEFQKLIDHPGIVENAVIGALAHLQLGRAQAIAGDKDAARKSYQDFLTLWKDADPDVPALKEAKAEYAKLQ